MSFPRAFSARPAGAMRAALAAALFFHGVAGLAAEEPDSGIFTTPGMPQRTSPSTPQRPSVGQAAPPNRDASGRTPAGVDPLQNGTRTPGQNGRGTGYGPDTSTGLRRPDLPPPKPSEFQRFVEGSTGRLLPIFGADFFSEAGETFLSLDNVPVSADYTIGPGDEILIRAWGSIDVDYRSTVDRNGLLNLPKVGSFNVAGVKASDLERNLRGQIGRLFTNF
jgi:hypothetical protein